MISTVVGHDSWRSEREQKVVKSLANAHVHCIYALLVTMISVHSSSVASLLFGVLPYFYLSGCNKRICFNTSGNMVHTHSERRLIGSSKLETRKFYQAPADLALTWPVDRIGPI
jgi:hypothetical protein